jgi:von Willebrand factor type A domain
VTDRLTCRWQTLPRFALAVGCLACTPDVSPTVDAASVATTTVVAPADAAGDAALPGPTEAGAFDECAAVAISANLIPANLLFVLDRSGSMNCVPPDGDKDEAALCKVDPRKRGDGPSKWEVTREALVDALGELGARDSVKVGFSLFPVAGTQCDVSTTPDLQLATTGGAALETMDTTLGDVSPDGETPIAGSTILGYAHLASELRARQIFGNTYLVLLTDGNETCKPSELEKLVEEDVPLALRAFGIRTFVVGAPGSEDARSLLSKIAYNGGTAVSDSCDHGDSNETANCHFDMTRSTSFSSDLSKVLSDIAQTKALSCEFQVPRSATGGGVNLGQVNVTLLEAVDGPRENIGKHPGETGSCDDKVEGWTYSADYEKILLCGASCEAAQAATEGRVEIILGCPTQLQPGIF